MLCYVFFVVGTQIQISGRDKRGREAGHTKGIRTSSIMDEGGKILDLGIGWTVGLRFQQFVRVSISFHLAADNPDGYVSSAYLYRSIRKFVAFFFVFCCENAPGRMTDFLRHICPSNWIFLL